MTSNQRYWFLCWDGPLQKFQTNWSKSGLFVLFAKVLLSTYIRQRVVINRGLPRTRRQIVHSICVDWTAQLSEIHWIWSVLPRRCCHICTSVCHLANRWRFDCWFVYVGEQSWGPRNFSSCYCLGKAGKALTTPISDVVSSCNYSLARVLILYILLFPNSI